MSQVARMFRAQREQDPRYLAWIRKLPCLICGDDITVEAAHIRYADHSVAKRGTGMGEKSDDKWAVPLCNKHHHEQHEMNEKDFWKIYEIDPVKAAAGLKLNEYDSNAADIIVSWWADPE